MMILTNHSIVTNGYEVQVIQSIGSFYQRKGIVHISNILVAVLFLLQFR